jgi:predicted dienelactone hydrolase
VVVAIDHPHDAGIVEFPDGHVVVAGPPLDVTAALTVRVADTRFVLTQLARLGRSGVFLGHLDLARVGMFGHSLGGAAAASTMFIDPRIRAGADLDGFLFEPARTGGLSRPFLLMNAEPGFAGVPNVAGFWSKLRGPHYAIDVKGARHFAFSDLVTFVPELMRINPTTGKTVSQLVGKLDGKATLAAERVYLRAFFDCFLREKPQPLLTRTPGPFAGMRLTVGGKAK